MSHTVKVNMISDQYVKILGDEINIHDIEILHVGSDGTIQGFTAKEKEINDDKPFDRKGNQKKLLPKNDTQELIKKECTTICDLLIQKNIEYGNSAIEPVRIFSSADSLEQIYVRIDDKLSRIKTKGEKKISEDTELDLIGYLILARVARQKQNEEN